MQTPSKDEEELHDAWQGSTSTLAAHGCSSMEHLYTYKLPKSTNHF